MLVEDNEAAILGGGWAFFYGEVDLYVSTFNFDTNTASMAGGEISLP